METITSFLPLVTIILVFLFIRSRKRKRQKRSGGYNLRGEWTENKINNDHVPHWERESRSKNDNNSQRRGNFHESYYEKMKYECIVCQYIISVDVNENFNTFFCNKCRSIFSYEIINEKININVIKKEFYIPKYVEEAISLFVNIL